MSYTVYEHIAPNGKRYIGITGRSVQKRWKNGYGYQAQPYFYAAIQKYSWKGVEHNIIAAGLSKGDAEAMEVRLISEYRSNERDFGYNVANGGNSVERWTDEIKKKIGDSNRGRKLSEGQRRYLSEIQIGKEISAETRAKMSAARKGQAPSRNCIEAAANSRRGKPISPNTKEKLRLANIGKPMSEKHKQKLLEANTGRACSDETKQKIGQAHRSICRTVEQITADGKVVAIHGSLMDAQDATGISNKAIWNACHGKVKLCGGYRWRYV